jgi:hypothetical protein
MEIKILLQSDIINQLNNERIALLSEEQLENLLREMDIIYEEETYFRDKIRILNNENIFLVQEKSNKEEILVRKVNTLEDGLKFIRDRVTIYENMWNGCGCKIDYYK